MRALYCFAAVRAGLHGIRLPNSTAAADRIRIRIRRTGTSVSIVMRFDLLRSLPDRALKRRDRRRLCPEAERARDFS